MRSSLYPSRHHAMYNPPTSHACLSIRSPAAALAVSWLRGAVGDCAGDASAGEAAPAAGESAASAPAGAAALSEGSSVEAGEGAGASLESCACRRVCADSVRLWLLPSRW